MLLHNYTLRMNEAEAVGRKEGKVSSLIAPSVLLTAHLGGLSQRNTQSISSLEGTDVTPLLRDQRHYRV